MNTKSLLPGLLSRDRDIEEEYDHLMTNSGAPDVDLSDESQNNTVTQNTSETHISRTDILNTLENKNDNSEEETNTIGSTTPSLEPNLMLSGSSVTVSEDNNNQSLNNKPTPNFPITFEAIKPTAVHSTSSLHSPQPSVLDRCPPYQEEHLQSKNC